MSYNIVFFKTLLTYMVEMEENYIIRLKKRFFLQQY